MSSSAPSFKATSPLAKQYFALQGWKAFPFQQEVWKAIAQGESGLLHATTGAGKTYAVWLGALAAWTTKSHKKTDEKRELRKKNRMPFR